ncbi:FtsX-like permease family protein [Catellatospora citrea]|nr:FtsX-like permease family protein [Catellatospora citrea]RKE10155.1 FtsX-like permease family protein [Catellatospora citrea]
MIWSQLRRRLWRSSALFAAILLATTGFTVLTGTVNTSRLQVTGEVDANFRGAYDILVRPKGARTAVENERGTVAPNQLSGTNGGITTAQYRAIQAVQGVEVAAPIATLGSTLVSSTAQVDVTDLVDRSKTRQLIRLDPVFLSDRGLSRGVRGSAYVYITRRPIIGLDTGRSVGNTSYYTDGTIAQDTEYCDTGVLEVQEDGARKRVCGASLSSWQEDYAGLRTPQFDVYSLLPDGRFLDGAAAGDMQYATDRIVVNVWWLSIVGLAAVDPAAEARLLGLDQALVSGRYLRQDETGDRARKVRLPVLTAALPQVDETLRVTLSTVDDDLVRAMPGTRSDVVHAWLDKTSLIPAGTRTFDTRAPQPDAVFEQPTLSVSFVLRSGLPRYDTAADGTLRPVVSAEAPGTWMANSPVMGGGATPSLVFDTAFRDVKVVNAEPFMAADPVGVFDPAKLQGFSRLSRVPLETYRSPEAEGADARSRELLGERPLAPSSNPAGYLISAPQLITTLAAVPGLIGAKAADQAISAVRVRVADVRTLDELTRERIRRIAEEISTTTGLDVDITVGSSLQPQQVALAAGTLGRPELRLTELWSRKGVAVAIMEAIDRKSVLLFGLILVVCVLFLANATTAAVRDRRRELAVLACVGWPRYRLAALVTGEVAVVGLAAGLVSAGLAVPLSRVVDVPAGTSQALLAVPLALLLAVVAAVVPAVQAARAHPGTALAPLVSPVRRARSTRTGHTVLSAALRNTRRRPGRTLLAAVAVALGVGAFTTLLTLTWVFHGNVTGTLLGDAVSLRVRAVDTVAVAATLVLAVLALADVLYLNVRERSAELATLQAAGWGDGALTRLIAYEGVLIGAAGALAGAGVGLFFVDRFAAAVPATAVAVTAAAALAGVVLSGLAAVLPALSVRRLRLSTLLAQE